MLLHPTVHWLHKCRSAVGRYVFLSDLLPLGRSGFGDLAGQYFQLDHRLGLCRHRTGTGRLGGTLIGYLKLESQVEAFVYQSPVSDHDNDGEISRRERLKYAVDQVIEIVHRVWIYVLIGVGIGAAIHNWIPEGFISSLFGQDKWWSVLVATIAGVPMYADIFGTLPVAEALVEKGVGLGTALTFMMAVTALSLPSMIMLKKVVKLPLLVVFVGIVTVGIILIGYTFNATAHLFI